MSYALVHYPDIKKEQVNLLRRKYDPQFAIIEPHITIIFGSSYGAGTYGMSGRAFGNRFTFFRNLPAEAWTRSGIASDNPFTVRALAYIVAGHLAHHVAIVQERYL